MGDMRGKAEKVGSESLENIGRCLHRYMYDNKQLIWQKPGATAGFFGVQHPALSGFFNVRQPRTLTPKETNPATSRVNFCTEDSMITKERPAIRSEAELQAIAERIKKEIEEEKARTRKFLAELFLAGPDAWPDVVNPE